MYVHRSPLFLKSYIDNNYDVIYQSSKVESDFSNVNEFLLAEMHDSTGCNEVNSLFINLFARKSDIVMVEAIPSMRKIAPHQALQAVHLRTQAPIVGWDQGTIQDMGFPTILQRSGRLEIAGRSKLKDLDDPLFEGSRQKLAEELQSLCAEAQNSIVPKLLEEAQVIAELVAATFPQRTKAMERSLRQARECARITYLISGRWHLIQSEQPDPRFSLAAFHDFLTNRHAVVLLPKHCIIEKIDEMAMARMLMYIPR